jgi:hypothetical protein
MTNPPGQPKVYHITHVENLAAIVAEGGLVSDREMFDRGGPARAIGMSAIKERRIRELEVSCHPGTMVGDYVPLYFCPRSVMLYVIYRANHPELGYRGGQEPIVHLEADLHSVIRWAEANGRRWAFSLSNAGARYAMFYSRVERLDQLDWEAIAATDFRSAQVKECKQAELLVHGRFPFDLVERIGVRSAAVHGVATAAVAGARYRPRVEVRQDWYF